MSGLLIKSLFKRLPRWSSLQSKRSESVDLRYNLSEENRIKNVELPDIVTTTYDKVMIIGINIPDASNALDDSALEKLNQRLNDFNTSDQYTVAVLHGIGRHFCTGIQETANKEKAKEILKTVQSLRKPTIATLTGFTTSFGFQLAIMCDFRIMEVGSVCGFGQSSDRDEIDVDICKRLLALSNFSATLEVVLSGGAIDNNTASIYGLVNRCVECGTGLAKSITLAQSIAKFPQDDVINQRNLIYSILLKK